MPTGLSPVQLSKITKILRLQSQRLERKNVIMKQRLS
jgi:hypothetical protein